MPTPEALLSNLTTTERASGLSAWTASAARTTPSIVRRSSRPIGIGTPASANTRRPPLLYPSGARAGAAPLTGSCNRTATWTSAAVTLYGSMNPG